MDREAWWATVHGDAESATTMHLSTKQYKRVKRCSANMELGNGMDFSIFILMDLETLDIFTV